MSTPIKTIKAMYAPPSVPPPHLPTSAPSRPTLIPTPECKVDLVTLARRGWVTLPLRKLDLKLYNAYSKLFGRSSSFFDLPLEEKLKYHIPAHEQTSEEGFSVVEGEKSLITIRRSCSTPDILLSDTQECWSASGDFLAVIMEQISRSLGMGSNKFEDMIKLCCTLPEKERVATLLRMFRYIRPNQGESAKIVAEPHRDLGLLTIVVGSSAGLEVLEPNSEDPNGPGTWVPIEAEQSKNGELTCTLLSGATLARLSNGIYNPGRHRVFVHPSTEEVPSPYRFSLVFALRAHLPVVVSSKMFTTSVTGPFVYPFGEDKVVRMGDIYQAISNAHFNINIDKQVREEQRKRVLSNGGSPASLLTLPPLPPARKKQVLKVSERLKAKKWSVQSLFKRIKVAS